MLESEDEAVEGLEDMIIFTSALYNLRQDEETIRRTVSECIGSN